jgi:IS4 transposase
MRLSRLLARNAGRVEDVDVVFARGHRFVDCRVVALPGREAGMTRLCTNLPRTPFATGVVALLYRFRWQIELCFK